MLDENIKHQLQSHFSAITNPIELIIALDDSNKSKEIQTLADDLASLSEHISIKHATQTNTRKPSMAVCSPDKHTHIEFAGVPMGHEFTSLVLALLQTGGHPAKASED